MTYEGRRFFGTESFEEKTRKYTRPHPVVTKHLQNLQNGFQVTNTWRNISSVNVPSLTLTPTPKGDKQLNISFEKRKRDFSKVTQKTNVNLYGKRQHLENAKIQLESSKTVEWKNSEYQKLSSEILDYFACHQQSAELLSKKICLRSALLSVFRKQFPTCSLHLVGSSCNGFATNSSDADFCLMLTHTRQVDQRSEACWYLKEIQKLLRYMSCIRNIQFIRAKVPILKFKDTISGCDCDINTNNSIGIRNTHLLRTYSKIDDRVRPLIMAVKHWAKSRSINDASQGTLSSYSLVMMVIHYLQSYCRPPVLTPIQQEYPQYFSLDRNVDDLPMFEPALLIPCNCSKNEQSHGELLFGFFKYYSLEFKWDEMVISVRLGQATPRSSNAIWNDAYICIEEPFDRTNTARAVHEYSKFKFIQSEFKRAYDKLLENLTLKNLL